MHDYEKGHTCPTCNRTGIRCTIEDGYCDNDGDCDNCIKQRYYDRMSRAEYDYDMGDY